MLKKPDVSDERIKACLLDHYRLHAADINFLPLGADMQSAVYRVVTGDETPYFLKLRSGDFNETAVTVPNFLGERGIPQIIAPLATITHHLWSNVDDFTLSLYPFIEGVNGFEVDLIDQQWVEFGTALGAIHSVTVPPSLITRLKHEIYSPEWREIVKRFQKYVDDNTFDDPISAQMAVLLKSERDEIHALIERAERLASVLQTDWLKFVLCHGDIHAGNILIDPQDRLFIVDWDNAILAPKERDLMFVGAGIGGIWKKPQEEALFYQGYGETEVNPVAIAYYRSERIIQDIAAYCEEIFVSGQSDNDRKQGLQFLTGQFMPDNEVDIAFLSEKNLPPELQSKSI